MFVIVLLVVALVLLLVVCAIGFATTGVIVRAWEGEHGDDRIPYTLTGKAVSEVDAYRKGRLPEVGE